MTAQKFTSTPGSMPVKPKTWSGRERTALSRGRLSCNTVPSLGEKTRPLKTPLTNHWLQAAQKGRTTRGQDDALQLRKLPKRTAAADCLLATATLGEVGLQSWRESGGLITQAPD